MTKGSRTWEVKPDSSYLPLLIEDGAQVDILDTNSRLSGNTESYHMAVGGGNLG